MAAQLLNFPQQQQRPGNSEPVPDPDDDGDYLELTRLRRQYLDYVSAKDAEINEAREARHYYHADQWTKEEIATLKRRKQPVVTSNRIVRKIDAVVGLIEKLRQDPKAYPRTPQHEQGADLATAVLRYVLDRSDWKSKSTRIARFGGINGLAGVEYDLEQGDLGDPELGVHIVDQETFFYDARSFDEGFTDCRYMGVAKWVDVDLAKELVPDKAEEIDSLVENGSDMTTTNDIDRERAFVSINEKRVRLIDHWYIKSGVWKWCLYIGNTMLMQGVSPFKDEKGKTFPRFRMFSASVDHDGDRYGFIRNLKSPQDEINHRRSKALHNLNTRRLITPKGAFDDVETARREMVRPDGVLEYNPVGEQEPKFDDQRQLADVKGQLDFLQEAKNEIENFGPNPALLGEGLENSSGRAIGLLQQAGLAELGPYLSSFRNWKIRVYRDIWNIITEHWKAERWIRVTDDEQVAQFFQINKLEVDQYGRPQIVNAIGSLDVDIIIDEGPDEVNMMADSYQVLQSLGPQFAQNFPEVALELAPLQHSVKKRMLDKIEQKQNQPPPPDPKIAFLQAQTQLKQQDQQNDMQVAQAKARQDAETARMKAANEIQIMRERANAEIEIERAKAQARAETERMIAMHNMQNNVKPPSESINFKDLPPEAQAQMLAQAGIRVSSDTMAAHAERMEPEPTTG